MEQFEFRKKSSKRWSNLQIILSDGMKLGLDLQGLLEKVESIKAAINDGIIRIVLLGSFSDGKTSAIAGMLGRLEDSMKIDEDESSDELRFYRPNGLKEGFEIVDTPGLFGTKEKEIDGKNIRFSEITEKYISEAHVVVYVCDAVTPLKDSHVEIIKKIMRDFKKLDSTIFVLNKMDEAGYDLTDEEDFARGERIKKDTLIERLKTTVNLTPDEEKQLKIVCIAADPKNKGLQYWFTKTDDYLRRSHIDNLRTCINSVVDSCDIQHLQSDASEASVKDLVLNVCKEIAIVNEPIKQGLEIMREQMQDLLEDVRQVGIELVERKKEMEERLINLQSSTVTDIKNATLDSIGEIIDKQIGEEGGQLTFYVFNHKLNSILSECGQSNVNRLQDVGIKMEKTFSSQDELLKDAAKKGGAQLKNVKVSGEQVKAVRDVVAKNFKFKPWGAIKLGKAITKAFGWIGAGIPVIIEAVDFIKHRKDMKKLKELKHVIQEEVEKRIHEAFSLFATEEKYHENFAPAYIELCQQLQTRNDEIERLTRQVQALELYKNRINNWAVKDVGFEEI